MGHNQGFTAGDEGELDRQRFPAKQVLASHCRKGGKANQKDKNNGDGEEDAQASTGKCRSFSNLQESMIGAPCGGGTGPSASREPHSLSFVCNDTAAALGWSRRVVQGH